LIFPEANLVQDPEPRTQNPELLSITSMKNSLWQLLLLFGLPAMLSAQAAVPDTTIFEFADAAPYPLLASCQPERHPGWTTDSVRRCAEVQLLNMVARNIVYPAEAREKNLEGTVVTSFVVEKNGRMGRLELLKDIGGGCGPEALRVLRALDEAGLRWKPGANAGQPVRMKYTLPLRFKLREALPYYVTEEADTLFTTYDQPAGFRGGLDSLAAFVMQNLDYPATLADSCRTGIVEMALAVRPDGSVKILNQLDFNNLGYEFQWKATRLALQSAGRWLPATYAGKPVPSSFPLRAVFKSPNAACALPNQRFDQAMLLTDEAAPLLEQNQAAAALPKLTEALRLHPDNSELLYYRGTAYLNLKQLKEACADFNRAKEIMGYTWFEDIRRLVCGW
jgi:hypothetical protein